MSRLSAPSGFEPCEQRFSSGAAVEGHFQQRATNAVRSTRKAVIDAPNSPLQLLPIQQGASPPPFREFTGGLHRHMKSFVAASQLDFGQRTDNRGDL